MIPPVILIQQPCHWFIDMLYGYIYTRVLQNWCTLVLSFHIVSLTVKKWSKFVVWTSGRCSLNQGPCKNAAHYKGKNTISGSLPARHWTEMMLSPFPQAINHIPFSNHIKLYWYYRESSKKDDLAKCILWAGRRWVETQEADWLPTLYLGAALDVFPDSLWLGPVLF